MRLPSAACSLKIVSRPKLKSLQLLTCSCHKNQNYESTNPFCINLKYCKVSFPSISYYFHIPIIFDYLDIHCPTEVMAVGTIIFPVRVGTIFFPIWTWIHWKLSITSPYQTDMLSSTKIVSQRNERISLPELGLEPGTSSLWVRDANHYTIWPWARRSQVRSLALASLIFL